MLSGSPLPGADTFDMEAALDVFQEFVANPNPYMEAFGIRAKRHAEVEDHSGFTVFPIPFIGVEVGVKHVDPSNVIKGGEAYLHVDDLKSLIPFAHSKLVKLHVKFDGGSSSTDGLFNYEVDYHLEHSDGHGTEEGMLKIVRELRGGKWHTNIKTESHPFAGGADNTIIPGRISNLEVDIESDRATMLNAKYVNPTMGRDLDVKIVRTKFALTGSNKEIEFTIDATNKGVKYTGTVAFKMTPGSATKVLLDLSKGSQKMLQLNVEVKMKGSDFNLRGKYIIMGLEKGTFFAKSEAGVLSLKTGPYKLTIELHLGRSINLKAEKDGVVMWTYKTLREDKSSGGNFVYEINSDMTLNPASKLHGAIEAFYPFGAFTKRSNKIKIFVDSSKNTLFNKFKVDFEIIKDDVKVVDLVADTTKSPYKFSLAAPNLFKKLEIGQDALTVSIDHQRGSSLVIDANFAGGLHLDINHAPNAMGGRTINVLATKAGEQMFKYKGDTSKVDDADMLKVGLKGNFDLSPKSIVSRLIVSKYRILTPFANRKSDFEFFWDKKNKNFLMNKFYVKGNLIKDDVNVFNLLVSTNQTPYKFHLTLPAVLGKLRSGMTEVDVDVIHNPGSSLEMKVNHRPTTFTGFKITRSGGQAEIEWDGKKLGEGEYTLTDKRFSTTQTINGKSLTTTVSWKNDWDSLNFLLDNKVHVKLEGLEKLDLDLDWGMPKLPDLDLSTPESGHWKMTAVGNNKWWGDYTIDRDISMSSANGKISCDLSGNSKFTKGPLASASPIETLVKASFDVHKFDLEGIFKKVIAGKEYSVTWPKGTFVMPIMKFGA